MRKKLVFLILAIAIPLLLNVPDVSAAVALPAHPSCNTLPNNTDCDDQPTPGGCVNDEVPQNFDLLIWDGNTLVLNGNALWSTHCKSNWPFLHLDTSVPGLMFMTEVQREAGPDGPSLDYFSPVLTPSQLNMDAYEGPLVYAPNEAARVQLWATWSGQSNWVNSGYSPWW